MSLDSGTNGGMANPVAGVEPPKSRKKLWIFGGLGCLGVIAVGCIGIIGLTMVYVYKPMQEFQNENVEMAISSPESENILGSPITAGPVVPVNKGNQLFEFRSTLTGPDGTGDLVFTGKLVGTTWERESIYLEKDGEEVALDPEKQFDLEIEDGQ